MLTTPTDEIAPRIERDSALVRGVVITAGVSRIDLPYDGLMLMSNADSSIKMQFLI